jgi:hypothetical protein
MPKWEVNATELTNTDVNFVALVKRGANRIPFRLTKSEDEPMIDLAGIGRKLFQKADASPAVIAFICRKGADIPALKDALVKADFSVELLKTEEKGGIVTLSKADADIAEGVMLLKVSDEIAIAVSNFKKSFGDYDVAASPFMKGDSAASISLATSMLHDRINEAGADYAAITKATSEYNDYVAVLGKSLPIQAMKADQVLKGFGKGKAKPFTAEGGTDDDQSTGDNDGDENAKTQKADLGKNGTGAGCEAGKGTGTTPRATEDDANNTPDTQGTTDGKTSGSDDGLPAKAKAKKEELLRQAQELIQKALTIDVTSKEITGESAAGEGAAQSPDDSEAAKRRGTAGDKGIPSTQGTVGGATLDMNGVPAGVKAQKSVAGNDEQGAGGEDPVANAKTKGNQPEGQSGAGAQSKDVQTLKGEEIMQAVSALSKSVQAGLAAMQKTVDGLSSRVEGVAEQAKKTEAALGGTVFNEAFGDHEAHTQKGDDDGAPALLDTGYTRRTA